MEQGNNFFYKNDSKLTVPVHTGHERLATFWTDAPLFRYLSVLYFQWVNKLIFCKIYLELRMYETGQVHTLAFGMGLPLTGTATTLEKSITDAKRNKARFVPVYIRLDGHDSWSFVLVDVVQTKVYTATTFTNLNNRRDDLVQLLGRVFNGYIIESPLDITTDKNRFWPLTCFLTELVLSNSKLGQNLSQLWAELQRILEQPTAFFAGYDGHVLNACQEHLTTLFDKLQESPQLGIVKTMNVWDDESTIKTTLAVNASPATAYFAKTTVGLEAIHITQELVISSESVVDLDFLSAASAMSIEAIVLVRVETPGQKLFVNKIFADNYALVKDNGPSISAFVENTSRKPMVAMNDQQFFGITSPAQRPEAMQTTVVTVKHRREEENEDEDKPKSRRPKREDISPESMMAIDIPRGDQEKVNKAIEFCRRMQNEKIPFTTTELAWFNEGVRFEDNTPVPQNIKQLLILYDRLMLLTPEQIQERKRLNQENVEKGIASGFQTAITSPERLVSNLPKEEEKKKLPKKHYKTALQFWQDEKYKETINQGTKIKRKEFDAQNKADQFRLLPEEERKQWEQKAKEEKQKAIEGEVKQEENKEVIKKEEDKEAKKKKKKTKTDQDKQELATKEKEQETTKSNLDIIKRIGQWCQEAESIDVSVAGSKNIDTSMGSISFDDFTIIWNTLNVKAAEKGSKLRHAALVEDSTFCDVGSGYGFPTFVVRALWNVKKSVGIEAVPQRAMKAHELLNSAKDILPSRLNTGVHLVNKEATTIPQSEWNFTHICFLDKTFTPAFKQLFFSSIREYNPDLRVLVTFTDADSLKKQYSVPIKETAGTIPFQVMFNGSTETLYAHIMKSPTKPSGPIVSHAMVLETSNKTNEPSELEVYVQELNNMFSDWPPLSPEETKKQLSLARVATRAYNRKQFDNDEKVRVIDNLYNWITKDDPAYNWFMNNKSADFSGESILNNSFLQLVNNAAKDEAEKLIIATNVGYLIPEAESMDNIYTTQPVLLELQLKKENVIEVVYYNYQSDYIPYVILKYLMSKLELESEQIKFRGGRIVSNNQIAYRVMPRLITFLQSDEYTVTFDNVETFKLDNYDPIEQQKQLAIALMLNPHYVQGAETVPYPPMIRGDGVVVAGERGIPKNCFILRNYCELIDKEQLDELTEEQKKMAIPIDEGITEAMDESLKEESIVDTIIRGEFYAEPADQENIENIPSRLTEKEKGEEKKELSAAGALYDVEIGLFVIPMEGFETSLSSKLKIVNDESQANCVMRLYVETLKRDGTEEPVYLVFSRGTGIPAGTPLSVYVHDGARKKTSSLAQEPTNLLQEELKVLEAQEDPRLELFYEIFYGIEEDNIHLTQDELAIRHAAMHLETVTDDVTKEEQQIWVTDDPDLVIQLYEIVSKWSPEEKERRKALPDEKEVENKLFNDEKFTNTSVELITSFQDRGLLTEDEEELVEKSGYIESTEESENENPFLLLYLANTLGKLTSEDEEKRLIDKSKKDAIFREYESKQNLLLEKTKELSNSEGTGLITRFTALHKKISDYRTQNGSTQSDAELAQQLFTDTERKNYEQWMKDIRRIEAQIIKLRKDIDSQEMSNKIAENLKKQGMLNTTTMRDTQKLEIQWELELRTVKTEKTTQNKTDAWLDAKVNEINTRFEELLDIDQVVRKEGTETKEKKKKKKKKKTTENATEESNRKEGVEEPIEEDEPPESVVETIAPVVTKEQRREGVSDVTEEDQPLPDLATLIFRNTINLTKDDEDDIDFVVTVVDKWQRDGILLPEDIEEKEQASYEINPEGDMIILDNDYLLSLTDDITYAKNVFDRIAQWDVMGLAYETMLKPGEFKKFQLSVDYPDTKGMTKEEQEKADVYIQITDLKLLAQLGEELSNVPATEWAERERTLEAGKKTEKLLQKDIKYLEMFRSIIFKDKIPEEGRIVSILNLIQSVQTGFVLTPTESNLLHKGIKADSVTKNWVVVDPSAILELGTLWDQAIARMPTIEAKLEQITLVEKKHGNLETDNTKFAVRIQGQIFTDTLTRRTKTADGKEHVIPNPEFVTKIQQDVMNYKIVPVGLDGFIKNYDTFVYATDPSDAKTKEIIDKWLSKLQYIQKDFKWEKGEHDAINSATKKDGMTWTVIDNQKLSQLAMTWDDIPRLIARIEKNKNGNWPTKSQDMEAGEQGRTLYVNGNIEYLPSPDYWIKKLMISKK